MLAFSVREALRQAAAAFGAPGSASTSPPPPRRKRCTGPSSWPGAPSRRARGRPCRMPLSCAPGNGSPGARRRLSDERDRRRRAGRHVVNWLRAVEPLRGATGPASSSPSPASAGTPRAMPAPRWSSPRTPTWDTIGGGNLEATAVARATSDHRGRGVEPAEPDAVAERQGARRARPAVLRRRGLAAARAAARRAGGGDLRPRTRRARAGPHPGPPRPRAAPRRLPRGAARAGPPAAARRRGRPASTSTTPPCPSSSSVRCRPARTCSS